MRLLTIPMKVRSAVRRGGVGELWRVFTNTMVIHLLPRGRRWKRDVEQLDIEFDQHRGTSTGGIISQWDIGPVIGSREGASSYQGTDAGELRSLLDALPLDFSTYTFLDLGSGKGRALLVAAEYPFRSVVGVEHANNLHAIAEKNIRIDRGPHRCRDVKSILADATAFRPPPGPLLVFLYSPFGRSAIEQVITNLQAANTKSGDILILFYTEYDDCMPSMFTMRGFAPVGPVGKFTLYRMVGQPSQLQTVGT